MSRRAALTAAAAGLVLLVAAGGAYAYFFSSLRSAPAPLALATPVPAAASPAAGTPTPAAGLAGSWQVAPGAQARFRVKETVAGLSAAHDAVAQSNDVTGGLALVPAGTDYRAESLRVVVGLAGLHSIDTLAGRDVSQRDGIVQRSLGTSQFPQATFEAGAVAVPSAIAGGQPLSLTVPGRLTLHGTTRDVTAAVQVQLAGDVAQAVGTIQIDMTDFGIQPPRAPGISPQSATTIEFQADLRRA